ncbi:hypothetical protein TEA_016979 [Camellia sinensis var. sinensis]|uniref:DRBM domain-containing protein n=1 Tax=Camellia sinensis var. sinensis TaxID=542762 RepID=A0A4S4D089_CAMSN|nr:hypothetical protein TEA_016979 [Camellia sinensis var. sinensis]
MCFEKEDKLSPDIKIIRYLDRNRPANFMARYLWFRTMLESKSDEIYESLEFSPTIKEAKYVATKVAWESLSLNEVEEDDPLVYKNLLQEVYQKKAAKVAWESLSLNEVEEDDPLVYKNLLQEVCQKKGFLVPKYERTVSGPPHMPTFISTVEIREDSLLGQATKRKIYESLEFFPTIKEAKQVVAKVAWESLSPNEVTEDDPPVYKNLLQEVCQKKGFVILKYERTISGPPYMPTFISTVEIKEDPFLGEATKSKKAAYMNAAKVAYFCLQ